MYQKQLGSHKSRSSSSSIVIASWNQQIFQSISTPVPECEDRPARINYFVKHSIKVCGNVHTHVVFHASWFQFNSQMNRYGKPITIWEHNIFEIQGCYSIIPVQFIKYRTVSIVDKVDNVPVLLACPCINF